MTEKIIETDWSDNKLITDPSNKVLESQQDTTIWYVKSIIDYTPEEVLKIDELMKFVNIIDDLIKTWKSFANSLEYNLFYLWYNQLSDREKVHFKDIYKDLRIKYLEAKIEAIENGPDPDSALSKATKEDYIYELIEWLPFWKNRW